jgi:hypothetical protein
MRGCALVVVLAGCRYGFEAQPDASIDAPDAAPPPPDYCARIPPLAAPPVLDGALDPGIALQTLVPVGWQSKTPSPVAQVEVPVRFAIAYRADQLYYFVDIADPDHFPSADADSSFCGDGVELYIDHDGVFANDPDFDYPGTTQFIGRAPIDASTPKLDLGERYAERSLKGAWQSSYGAYPRAGGYTFEAIIVASDLDLASWSLVAGGRVGIDLSVNFSTTDGSLVSTTECPKGTRVGQFFLRVDEAHLTDYAQGAPYYWPAAYCSALLD